MNFSGMRSHKTMVKIAFTLMLADMFLKGMLYGMYVQKKL